MGSSGRRRYHFRATDFAFELLLLICLDLLKNRTRRALLLEKVYFNHVVLIVTRQSDARGLQGLRRLGRRGSVR